MASSKMLPRSREVGFPEVVHDPAVHVGRVLFQPRITLKQSLAVVEASELNERSVRRRDGEAGSGGDEPKAFLDAVVVGEGAGNLVPARPDPGPRFVQPDVELA